MQRQKNPKLFQVFGHLGLFCGFMQEPGDTNGGLSCFFGCCDSSWKAAVALQRKAALLSASILPFAGLFLFCFNILGLKLTFSSNLCSPLQARGKEWRRASPSVIVGCWVSEIWRNSEPGWGNSAADLRASLLLCSRCLWCVSAGSARRTGRALRSAL